MIIERRQLIGYAICLLAFAFVVWSFYPGVMTADSIAALSQGRSGVYGDVNAPVMSWFWGRLDSLVPGPALIFVIHLGIFWTACAVFWRSTIAKSTRLAVALVLFGLLPHILAQTVVVWKDIALGTSLLMAAALIYLAKEQKSKIALLISPLFLFYAYAARLNALPAVLPIAIWSVVVGFEIFEVERNGMWRKLLVGSGYLVLLSIVVFAVNSWLTGGRTDHPAQQIYLYDLAGISSQGKEVEFPASQRDNPHFSPELVRSRYNERSVSDLIFPNIPNPGDRPPLKWSSDGDEVRELRDVWLEAIKQEPAAYVRHRSDVFAQLIGLRRSVTAPYVAEGFASNPPEFRGGDNLGYAMLMKYFGGFRRPFPQTFFFRAIVWIVICGVLIFVAVRRRLKGDWDLVFVLSVSNLLFILAYFPTTPSTEFRYLYWPAIATAVAVIFGTYLLRLEKVRPDAEA